MKAILLAMTISVAAGPAFAIERYQISRMSCDSVQAAVENDGAAILRWQSSRTGLPRYDRYVSDSSFCNSGEVAKFASVPTADDRTCAVQKCEMIEPRERFGSGRILIPN